MRFGTLRAAAPPQPVDDKTVRRARVEMARKMGWEEILPKERLRPRARWLVDSSTDSIYSLFRGAGFQRGSARVIAERNDLAFYVGDDGEPVLLELLAGTWSEKFARLAQRSAAR